MPTDQRYKELTDESIEVLFQSFLQLADDESYRQYYREQMKAKKMEETLPVNDFEEMGYTPEEIAQMVADLESRK